MMPRSFFPSNSSSNQRTAGGRSLSRRSEGGAADGFGDFVNADQTPSSSSSPTWRAKELTVNNNNNSGHGSAGNMDPFGIDRFGTGGSGSGNDAFRHEKKGGGSSRRNRGNPPTPDRVRPVALRSQSPSSKHQPPASDGGNNRAAKGGGGAGRSSPTWTMMMSVPAPAAVPPPRHRSHSRGKTRTKSAGPKSGFEPVLSDDEAWNQESNWFGSSQSFENNNATTATGAALAPSLSSSSSQQALGTVLHPILVDSDLESRERDVLQRSRTKKHKDDDRAETVRDQDVLAARNKSLRLQQQHPQQLEAGLSSQSQDSSGNNSTRRGILRLFGGFGRKESIKRNTNTAPSFDLDVSEQVNQPDSSFRKQMSSQLAVDSEALTPRRGSHPASTTHERSMFRTAFSAEEEFAHHHPSGRHAPPGSHHHHHDARVSDESTVSEVTDPTFFRKDSVPRTIVSSPRRPNCNNSTPPPSSNNPSLKTDPFDVQVFALDPFISDPSPRRLSTPVGSDDFSDPFFPPAGSSSAAGVGGVDPDFVVKMKPAAESQPRDEKKDAEWEPVPAAVPTSSAAITRLGNFQHARARLSASPPRARQGSASRSRQVSPSREGREAIMARPAPSPLKERYGTPSKQQGATAQLPPPHATNSAVPLEAHSVLDEELKALDLPMITRKPSVSTTGAVAGFLPVVSARFAAATQQGPEKSKPLRDDGTTTVVPLHLARYSKSKVPESRLDDRTGPAVGLKVRNLSLATSTDMRGQLIAGFQHDKTEQNDAQEKGSKIFLLPGVPSEKGVAPIPGLIDHMQAQRRVSSVLSVSESKLSKRATTAVAESMTLKNVAPRSLVASSATQRQSVVTLPSHTEINTLPVGVSNKLRRRTARRALSNSAVVRKEAQNASTLSTTRSMVSPRHDSTRSATLTNRERLALLRTRSPPPDTTSKESAIPIIAVKSTSPTRRQLVGNQSTRAKPQPEMKPSRKIANAGKFESRASDHVALPQGRDDLQFSDDETCDTCSLASARSDIRRLRTYMRRSIKTKKKPPPFDRDFEEFVSEFAIYDEAKLKDPMHRAGLRLLSAAVIPIQSAVRRHLALRKALTRMWAIVILQSLARRQMAHSKYVKARDASIAIQAWYRGCTVRDEALLKECCAIEIQRIVRGHLATIRVYEDIFRITIVQSVVRRKIAIDYATDKMILVLQLQGLVRGFLWRCHLKKLNKASTAIQSKWRSFRCQFGYQLDLLDIIIVQSLWRKKRDTEVVEGMRWIQRNSFSTRIQSTWRAYRARVQFFDIIAALTIQTRWRTYVCSTWYKQYRSACVIQSLYRGYICSSWLRQYLAARKVQTCFRAYVYSTWYRQYKAATTIQKCFRMHVYSTWYRQYKAATTIQKYFRMHVYSTWYKQYKAATAIQKCFRMHVYSTWYRQYKAATAIQKCFRMHVYSTWYRQYMSARSIQACFRRYVYTTWYRQYRAAVKAQACWRSYVCSKRYLQYVAATLVQSHVRRRICETAYKEYLAARRIQATFRCHQLSTKFSAYIIDRKMYLAATSIQSQWRCYVCSREYLRTIAAIFVQASWRRFVWRRLYLKHMAAIRIQSIWRSYACSRNYLRVIAAIMVQTKWRSFVCRREYRQQTSAILLQSHWRAFICSKQYLLILASIIIQTHWRSFACRSSYLRFRSALRIQTKWRAFCCRDSFIKCRSAILIQCHWRAYTCTLRFLQNVADVLIVQCYVRRWLAQRKVDQIRYSSALVIQTAARAHRARSLLLDLRDRKSAAIKIQRVWRGFVAFEIYMLTVADIVLVQSLLRRWVAASLVDKIKVTRKEHAARVLQRFIRSFQTKKWQAATKIQRFWRDFVCEAEYAIARYENAAAVIIQTQWRRFVVFSEFVLLREGAKKVQAVFRGNRSKKTFCELRLGAQKVQRVFRGFSNRKSIREDLIAMAALDAGLSTEKDEQYCATTIQAHARRCFARNVTLKILAARKIQACWRACCVRWFFIEYISARRIQAKWRGYTLRSVYSDFVSARRIQTSWRRCVVRKAFVEYTSARRIQTTWRCYVNVVGYMEYKAVRKIQASWRCFHCRLWYEEYKATRLIQAAWRGYCMRLAYKEYRAASVLQASWRRYHARQAYIEYVAARSIQAAWRRYTARLAYTEYIAARLIQAVWRGHSTLRSYKMVQAATLVQAAWRGTSARWCIREFLSARKIQAVWRGQRMYRFYLEYRSATKIQSLWRQKRDRATFLLMREEMMSDTIAAAIVAQKIWRGVSVRMKGLSFILWHRRLFVEDPAATTIQKAWRGYVAIQSYWHTLGSAIQIQGAIRGWLIAMSYRRTKATILLQRCTRKWIRQRKRRQYTESARIQSSTPRMRSQSPLSQLSGTSPSLLAAAPRARSPFHSVVPRPRSPLVALRTTSSVQSVVSRSTPVIRPKRDSVLNRSVEEQSVVKIQAICRRYLARSEVAEMLGAVILLQSTARGFLAKRNAVMRKQEHIAAVRIQRFFLMIKREVDREIKAAKKRRKAKRKSRKVTIEDAQEDAMLETIWRSTVESMRDTSEAVRLAQDAVAGELRSRGTYEKQSRASSSSSRQLPVARAVRDKEPLETNPRRKTHDEAPVRKTMTTGELMLSMMTPDWVRNAAASYNFKIPPSRLANFSRDEMEQDLCLEEAWIDTEISQAKGYRHKTSHRSQLRAQRMEV